MPRHIVHAVDPMEEVPAVLLWVLYWLAVAVVAAAIWLAIGGVWLRRRNLHQTPRLAAALFLAACAGSALSAGRAALGHSQVAIAFWAISPILFLLFFYLFSDSRYVSRNVRWLAVFFALSQIGQVFGAASQSSPSPQGAAFIAALPHHLLNSLLLLGDGINVAFLIVGIVPQIYSRRRHLAASAPSELVSWRRLAAAVGTGVALVALSAAVFTQPFGTAVGFALFAHTVVYLATTLLPVPLAFAVLSVRPLDRQALLVRAVSNSVLALCLIVAYALVCGVVQAVGFPQSLAVVAGALVAAGLFRPLRSWLWPLLERRVAPDAHRARRALAELTATLPGEVHLDALCDRIIQAVETGWDPESLVFWVRTVPSLSAQAVARLLPDGGATAGSGTAQRRSPTLELQAHRGAGRDQRASAVGTLVIAADDPLRAAVPVGVGAVPVERLPASSAAAYALKAAGAVLTLSVVSEDDLLGVLALGPKTAAPGYTVDECEMLDDLARVVAPALRVALVVHEQDTDARARERAEQEMRTARRIQQSLLPRELPALDGWRMHVYYEPARDVGGDFYDFLRFEDGRLGIVLGDVTDKGVPAALVMATTRSMLRAVAQSSTPPGAVLARVNDLLHADLPPNMFVTCFYGILDPATGCLHFANAGQDLPYLRDASACVREVHATGMPLGLMPSMTYEENEVILATGDSVLFYSDGLVEAHDPRRGMFGFPRLAAYLGRDIPAEGSIAGLLRELASFTGADWEQEDDITLLALERAAQRGS